MSSETFLNPLLYIVLGILVHIAGIVHAVAAIYFTRTAQGATTWVLCLILFPYITIPLFWAFGPRRFYSYHQKLSEAHAHYKKQISLELQNDSDELKYELPEGYKDDQKFFEMLADAQFTRGNGIEIYTRGEDYYKSIFEAIDQAKDYILVQYFIVRADEVGEELAERLIRKQQQGVQVYFLYDQIGSFFLPNRYLTKLREQGIKVEAFRTTRTWGSPFLINFRNHRKTIICDGKRAFVGGSNVGKEYRYSSKRYGRWRDTDLQLCGPAVRALQMAFSKDWYWATEQMPASLYWESTPVDEDLAVLPIHTGPATAVESGSLLFLNLLTVAQKRIWIATPYFVPDEGIMKALQLAAFRGLDVRIILPRTTDSYTVALATAFNARQIHKSGVKVYRYTPGFIHAKSVLIDDLFSVIGTSNLDNRSLSLNFEMNVLTVGAEFAKRMEMIFEEDFSQSMLLDKKAFEQEGKIYQFATRVARLFSPIL